MNLPRRAAQLETQAVTPERTPETKSREALPSEAAGLSLAGGLAVAAGGAAPENHAAALRRATAHPGGLAAPWVLHLQRQHGNRHVQRVVALAREAADPAGGEVSPDVARAIAGSRGGGRALDAEVRGRMEPAFGTDFAGVRIHTGAAADQLNRQLSARAFTTGSDVFFRHGEYNPGSSSGRELLAHELTHVVQQQGTVQTSRLTVGPPGDRFEQEADAVAREVMRGETVEVQSGGAGVARRVQRDEALENDFDPEKLNPLVVPAGTFDQAAQVFSGALLQLYPTDAQAGVVVINGPNVRLYDGYGQPAASMAFRLKRPAGLQPGVYSQLPGDLRLHKVYIHPAGKWVPSPGTVTGDIDFRRDVEPRQPFDTAFKGFKGVVFYIVPGVRPDVVPEDELPKQPPESQPEFMKLDTHDKADLPAYPAAVVPLTPQVTAVGTTGKFYCKLDKILWTSTIDNVFALLERVNFKWEVLKLDPKLLVTEKETATRWDATKAHFKTRARHLRDDEKTLRGDERASVPEKVFRSFLADQVAAPRRILAYSGETALTLLHSLVGGGDPNVEDSIDYMFTEPGDYFVRCLASPVMGAEAKHRRATSVAGVMVSVFNIQDVAKEALTSPEGLKEHAESSVKTDEARLDELRRKRAAATDPEEQIDLDAQIKRVELHRAYREAQAKVTGDPYALLLADLDHVRAQLAWVTGPDAPRYQRWQHRQQLQKLIENLRQEEKKIAAELQRADDKLGDQVHRTGLMPAVLIDDTTGARSDLTFSIGERSYVASDRTEVVIADITSEKGRVFNGLGSGRREQGRADAWSTAMRDLRRNLNRGRGLLAWRAPAPYDALSAGIDNPMKMEVAELDQLKEMADDTANALTLVALIAAPFTEGASLAILAVLAPVQAGSSLYNIVNRALYDDLEIDQEALGDFVNIATLGLGKVATASKLAGRGVQIVASGSRIALRLLEGGMYVVMTFDTFQQLMEDKEGETPEEARVRKLRALLQFFEGAAIPVASHLWPGPHAASENLQHAEPGRPPVAEPEGLPAPATARPAESEPPAKRPAEEAPARPAAARPPSTAGGGNPPLPAEILKVVPKDVQKHAPPVINPALKEGTVRIAYDVDANKVITEMRLEIGPVSDPSSVAKLVELHIPTARDMARYKGLSGRVRLVYEQIVSWLKRNPQAEPNSRAWEAEREVRKLQLIVEERARLYDATADPSLRRELSQELDHLEGQLIEHARAVDLFDVEGRGFVAVEGRGPGGEPTFGPETSRLEAFRKLGGYETRAGTAGKLEAANDFRRFVDVLTGETLLKAPEDLIPQMPDPRGLGQRTVLDQTKAPWLDKLVAHAADPARLRSLPAYHEASQGGAKPAEALHAASAAEAQRIADLLPEADRDAFLAAWKARTPAPAEAAPVPAPAAVTNLPKIRDIVLNELGPAPEPGQPAKPSPAGEEPEPWYPPSHPSQWPTQESEWILATNEAGAVVFKSLTPVSVLPHHVEGIVVRALREGKKVTIITGYHGSSTGHTIPEKKFAIDDAKFYGKGYSKVEVIDTSEMTHDQRLAVIDSTPGIVIVNTCYGACAKPSTAPPARPAGSPPLALPPGEPVKTPLLLPPGEAAKTPLLLGPGEAPAPAFKTLDQILTPDKAGFMDKDLQDAYRRYVSERTKAGETAASPEEWVTLTRGGPRERLEKLLGPDYHFGTGGTGVERLIPLTDLPQPVSYMQERVEADVAEVTRHPGKLWERLGRLQTEGITGGAVGLSLFNILKGNVAEILSGKIQDSVLAKVRRTNPDAKLYTDVRARLVKPDGTLSEPVLFTDNVVASERGGNLQLHSVFEVKAGSHGGQEATTQIFEWIEGHLTDGLEVHVGGQWYRYDPAATTGPRVVGLARAERHLIAVKGAEHLGQDSEFKTVREATRHALPQTAEEINYLTRTLIDRFIAKHPAPVATP